MADNKSKRRYVYSDTFLTRRIQIGFSHLYKPNTEGVYAHNKYEITWRVKKDDTAFMDTIHSVMKAVFEKNKAQGVLLASDLSKISPPYSDGDIKADDKVRRARALGADVDKAIKNAEYDRGHWVFKARSKDAPTLCGYAPRTGDQKTTKISLPDGVTIELNDWCRVALNMGIFLKEETLTERFNLTFSAVQLLAKGVRRADADFTEDDEMGERAATQGEVLFD